MVHVFDEHSTRSTHTHTLQSDFKRENKKNGKYVWNVNIMNNIHSMKSKLLLNIWVAQKFRWWICAFLNLNCAYAQYSLTHRVNVCGSGVFVSVCLCLHIKAADRIQRVSDLNLLCFGCGKTPLGKWHQQMLLHVHKTQCAVALAAAAAAIVSSSLRAPYINK